MARVTIRDVAREAGVSVGTVSRSLNGSGPVRAGTLARVREAMDRLGFRPSEAGRALRRGASRSIGVMVPTVSNPIFARSLEGIEAVARERGYSTVLMSANYDPGSEDGIVATLVARGVDGLVLTLADTSPTRLGAIRALGRPHVLLYNQPVRPAADDDGNAPAEGERPALATVDSRAAARGATERAMAFGHRRIAFLGGHFATSDRSLARYEGYRDAMEAVGLPVWPPEEIDFAAAERAFDAVLGRLVGRLNGPTALLCSNDLLALQTVAAVRRLGLDVPGDVSVIGFDGIPVARLVEPTLATVRQPARSMGRAAAQLLFDMIDGAEPRRIVMPTRFLDGGTLARPREGADRLRAGPARQSPSAIHHGKRP